MKKVLPIEKIRALRKCNSWNLVARVDSFVPSRLSFALEQIAVCVHSMLKMLSARLHSFIICVIPPLIAQLPVTQTLPSVSCYGA